MATYVHCLLYLIRVTNTHFSFVLQIRICAHGTHTHTHTHTRTHTQTHKHTHSPSHTPHTHIITCTTIYRHIHNWRYAPVVRACGLSLATFCPRSLSLAFSLALPLPPSLSLAIPLSLSLSFDVPLFIQFFRTHHLSAWYYALISICTQSERDQGSNSRDGAHSPLVKTRERGRVDRYLSVSPTSSHVEVWRRIRNQNVHTRIQIYVSLNIHVYVYVHARV